MNRRGFITGMAGILAAGVAPAVLPSGIIMPIRQLWKPSWVKLGHIVSSGCGPSGEPRRTGEIFACRNNTSDAMTVGGILLPPGKSVLVLWNGERWVQ